MIMFAHPDKRDRNEMRRVGKRLEEPRDAFIQA
jgi:hypothetical protein